MNKIRVYIASTIYAKAFNEGWMDALSTYVYLSKEHTGKNFYFKYKEKTKMLKLVSQKYGIGFSTLLRHINKLEKEGLIVFERNEMRLISKRQMRFINDKNVFVPGNINSIKEIKIFFAGLAMISCLVGQVKAFERKERFSYISEQMSKKFGKCTSKDVKKYDNYIRRGGTIDFKRELTLSVNKIGELIGKKSKNTITKIKKFFKDKGILKIFNQKNKIFQGRITLSNYLDLKKEDFISINTYFYKGWVFECKPSVYTLSYRG
ncbi:hypothetical protein ACMGDK_11465 [Chryseobacterium sp. DT-3]|uniref:hypothetical protein n=1 Tax=Chryseobacterium sp. DT-3 TaxID=3396164 RepID=UPI003F1C5243